jgi:hypothetical protein
MAFSIKIDIWYRLVEFPAKGGIGELRKKRAYPER